jgi:hypothetical protein
MNDEWQKVVQEDPNPVKAEPKEVGNPLVVSNQMVVVVAVSALLAVSNPAEGAFPCLSGIEEVERA